MSANIGINLLLLLLIASNLYSLAIISMYLWSMKNHGENDVFLFFAKLLQSFSLLLICFRGDIPIPKWFSVYMVQAM
ncbi:MAG: hypothetical protein LBE84_08555, partial [Planctomycetota bacterium]|nr:hypothetical protein [Planctomycetota bacterium]